MARPSGRAWLGAAAATAALLCLSFSSLFIGATDISPAHLLDPESREARVFLASRVPRLAAILLSGTALAIAGLVMQHLARNRFVAPSTAGTIESASLGILVATLLVGSASVVEKMAVAFVFALAGTLVFITLIRRVPLRDPMFVPLVGLMLGAVVGSVTTFLAFRFNLLGTVSNWTAGDFSGIIAGRYEALFLAAAACLVAWFYADQLTITGLGREVAVGLGVAHERMMRLGLGVVAMVTAIVVVVVGALPFLGLVVPNVVTMWRGDDLRRAIPWTALGGALFVLASDIIGRTVHMPYEIPVGTVMGIVGAVVFLVLILRSPVVARGH